MAQTLMVESFENSGQIVAVGRQAIGLRSDYNLKTELREFQAEYLEDQPNAAPVVRVRLNAKLIRQPRLSIVAGRNFEHVVQARSGEMAEIVAAFDEALGRVMKEIVGWTLTTAR